MHRTIDPTAFTGTTTGGRERRRRRWGTTAVAAIAVGGVLFVGTPTAAAQPALPPLPAFEIPGLSVPGVGGIQLSPKQQAAILAAVFDATGVFVQEVAGLVLGDIQLTPATPDPNPLSALPSLPLQGVGGSMLPLAPGTFEVTSGYGMRNNPTGSGIRDHDGIDFGAPQGTPIRAVTGGTVVQASDAGDGYGKLVRIKKGDTEVLYGHQNSIDVAVGDTVVPGQTLGTVGSTGNSTGPHLHFEVRRGGEAVDPVGYLTALGLRV